MDFMNVNRPGTATSWTVAAENLFDLAFDYVSGDVFGSRHNVGVLVAFIVAETVDAVVHAAHQDSRVAIAAFSHGLVKKDSGFDAGRSREKPGLYGNQDCSSRALLSLCAWRVKGTLKKSPGVVDSFQQRSGGSHDRCYLGAFEPVVELGSFGLTLRCLVKRSRPVKLSRLEDWFYRSEGRTGSGLFNQHL
jgi:hypothetical protein